MVRTIRHAAIIVIAALAMLVGLAGPASAKPAYAPPQVKFVSDVTVSPSGADAYVVGLYRCYGGKANTHLWVSVKQGPNISLPDNTSSSDAVSWYDTNWNFGVSDTGLLANCNGNWQVQRIDLKPETFEATGAVSPRLASGSGFVQFCLFDSTAPPDDQNPSQGFAFNYSIKHVFAL